MQRTSVSSPLLSSIAALALLAGACDEEETESGGADSETTMSMSGSTTTPPPGSTGGDSSSGGVGTTDGGSTSGVGSTGAGSTDTGPESSSDEGSSGTSSGTGTDTGADTGDSGSTDGPAPPSGDWVDCYAGEDCNSVDATCLQVPQSTGYSCIFAPDPVAGCVDASDCPAAPATGNAPVTCGSLDFDPSQDECFLDCSAGQTCPDGQECLGTHACGYPSTTTVGPYEPCDGTNLVCDQNFVCLVNDNPPTAGSCIGFGCNSVADCVPGPPGTMVVCEDLNPILLGNECYVECSVDADCPGGGTCLLNQACVFPLP